MTDIQMSFIGALTVLSMISLLLGVYSLLLLSLVQRRLDALESKQREHDLGFFRILDWAPDAGGIVRAKGPFEMGDAP